MNLTQCNVQGVLCCATWSDREHSPKVWRHAIEQEILLDKEEVRALKCIDALVSENECFSRLFCCFQST